jgi:hypothetical protein
MPNSVSSRPMGSRKDNRYTVDRQSRGFNNFSLKTVISLMRYTVIFATMKRPVIAVAYKVRFY